MDVSIENVSDLGRKMSITVPAAEVDKMMAERLDKVKETVKMPGFRPGKVPMDVVKKQYGDKVITEVTEHLISDNVAKAITDKEIRVAGQPKIEETGLPEEGKDYTFTVSFDVYPKIEVMDMTKISLKRYTAEPTEKMMEDFMGRLSGMRKSFAEKDGVAETGDNVIINSIGYVGEEAFAGGDLKDFPVELGSGQLIPGFEAGLIGLKAGDKKDLEVTFPAEYHSKELAGKDAIFKTEVVKVESPSDAVIDDEFAKSFGETSLDGLKEKLRGQLISDLATASQQRLKRELFDVLNEKSDFAVPATMVDGEFNALWHSYTHDLEKQGTSVADMDKSEDELKTEFRELSERRVCLGLLLSEIGQKNEIQIKPEEVQAEIAKIAARNPGQEEQVQKYFADPQRQGEVAGPLFEQKVTDWILEQCKIADTEVSADELLKEVA